ncbi:MAG: hypothetical protein HFE90_03075 [Firmicutes bacterium]|nr:hypothetical protein [Bacillota bacterium]
MMEKYKILLRMQMYGLFGINRLLHSNDKKEKRRFALIAITTFIIAGVLVYFSVNLSSTLAEAGLAEVLPAFMTVIYSFIVLTLTFLKSTGTLIGSKDYDIVISLPVKSSDVVLSRLTMLYFMNLIIGIIILLPMIIVYGIYEGMSAASCTVLIGSFLMTPILPMSAALIVNIFIVSITSRVKHSNMAALILSFAGVLAFVFASTRIDAVDKAQIVDIGRSVVDFLGQFYPPAAWVSLTLMDSEWLNFLYFAMLNLGVGSAFAVIISYFYKRLNTRALSHHADKDFQFGKLKSSSPFAALYKKEIRRLFTCTVYALNSLISIVLMILLSFAAAFFTPELLFETMESMGVSEALEKALPLAVSVLAVLCCTTSASLSLEGKNRWIMCAAPVKPITVLNSKIAVNMTVTLPAILISVIFLKIAFSLTLAKTALLFAVPAAYAVFISVAGMFLNVKFPKYDWKSEYYAVKGGSVSVVAAVGTGLAASITPMYLCIYFSEYAEIIMTASLVLILVVSAAIYRILMNTKLYM